MISNPHTSGATKTANSFIDNKQVESSKQRGEARNKMTPEGSPSRPSQKPVSGSAMSFGSQQAKAGHQTTRNERQSCTSDICFSLSNIALIVACLVALLFLAKFLSNDPLYEYVEYIVSLAFYRQLIYITVIVPLALLVPLYNTLSACLPFERRKCHQSPYLIARILYLALLVVLLFVGLAFVVGYVRVEAVSKQIDHEMRKHMELRYTNPFSFQFTESIQRKYECCDTLWYRNSYFNKLPLSCVKADTGNLDHSFTQTCSNVLGYLISNRCIVISVCLLVAIIALISLIVIDVMDLMRRDYNVAAQESYLHRRLADNDQAKQAKQQHSGGDGRLLSLPRWPGGRNSADDGDEADDEANDEYNEHLEALRQQRQLEDLGSQRDAEQRLEQRDRARDEPLLPAKNQKNYLHSGLARDDEPYPDAEADLEAYLEPPRTNLDALTGGLGQRKQRITKTIVTTRTSYIANKRTQSPVLVPMGRSKSPSGETGSLRSQDNSHQQHQSPTKGVLKTSRTNLMTDDDTDEQQGASSSRQGFHEPDSEDLQEHQLKLHRDLQTRRSLLNVRFAD